MVVGMKQRLSRWYWARRFRRAKTKTQAVYALARYSGMPVYTVPAKAMPGEMLAGVPLVFDEIGTHSFVLLPWEGGD